MYHGIQTVGCQPGIHGGGEGIDARRQQVGEERADDVEGQVEDQQHDAEENGEGQVLVGDDAVDGLAAGPLSGLPAFDHRLGADAFNEVVPHIRQGGVAVHAVLGFHLLNAVLNELQLVLIQL